MGCMAEDMQRPPHAIAATMADVSGRKARRKPPNMAPRA